ncbi:MFS transporter [Jeotgalicoccus coquinae]|uniref:Quinolone resistance protein NorA n=1 Tax=Jeotgalicoccus coquinae TaxID=709509 RepID=A0A6V7RMM6_9STAP|nr:MFS transporter [Jeotgalicoccus coquinae]MBB6422124.1 MFS family permease [Jeotgalicoccus coquinae]GGE18460.1 MFS transporter [Jeotgalicoccus coquinae]CAD2079646.1 Tetracycline resistance protein, class C [Jeotgalicoccus coquinae]
MKSKIILYLVIVICFLDLFIQLPIITPFALELGASEFMAGIVVAMYSLFNMVGNIAGGYMSDKFGRRNTLLFGMIMQIFFVLIYTTAPSIGILLAVRAIHGFSSGLLTPAAFSLIADISRKSAIGKSMALTGVAIGTAAILGPAAGGIISSAVSYEMVYYILSGVYVFGTILTFFGIKESSTDDSRTHHAATPFKELLLRPALNVAYISSFTLMIAQGTLAFGLPIKTGLLGLEASMTGMMLSVFGITAIIVFASPINKIYSVYKSESLVAIGILILSGSMMLLHFAPSAAFIFIVMVIYGFGFGFIFPSMNKIVAEHSEMNERGKANGIFYSYFSLGSVAGSVISGYLATVFNLPFLGIGIVTLIMLMALLFIRYRLELNRS